MPQPEIPHLDPTTDPRWQEAVRYFRERSPVLFLSDCRFWEPHGFVQQSLARALVHEGIPVIWLDGAGWRPYSPVVRPPSPFLRVEQRFQLPGRRVGWVNRVSLELEAFFLRRELRRGKRPFVWVQSGIDERLARKLPYVDAFSVFDDPYAHGPKSELTGKAKLILCQNTFAAHELKCPEKTKVLFPPIDLPQESFRTASPMSFPVGFPETRFGYVGSFFPEGFDLDLFQAVVKAAPNYGFVLAGRTNAAGAAVVESLKAYRNFFYCPWMPREAVGQVWRSLQGTLLLYRPLRSQDGAFPTKLLESLFFSIPAIATRVAKTEDLENYFPRVSTAEAVVRELPGLLKADPDRLAKAFAYFQAKMNPREHLCTVAETLAPLDRHRS